MTFPQIRGDVQRRPSPQGSAGRARISSAVSAGQPTAAFRRIREERSIKSSMFPQRLDHMSWSIVRKMVEQIIRPTGLVDPVIEVRPTKGQIDDLIGEIHDRIAKDERVLVTTLTKKMAEDLTDYLKEIGIKVRYLHSDIKTLERMAILRDLRLGYISCLDRHQLVAGGLGFAGSFACRDTRCG